ncbi:urea carboxylase-associated family protein [Rhodobacteraceae bacterium]|nr:urea carboxylase-associated family protein [Paracoccaceae bacterium]
MESTFTLIACTGRAFYLGEGATLRIVNTFGTQVVDAWAFNANDSAEFMSMEHTRVHAPSPIPVKGTVFRSNKRQPMLEFIHDTSPGDHDWFFAACDQVRYEILGHTDAHANCSDNLKNAMAETGNPVTHVPCPLNLFENAPLLSGDTGIYPPTSRPGDSVELAALADLIVCLSACPQDMADTNGSDRLPKDVEVTIIR